MAAKTAASGTRTGSSSPHFREEVRQFCHDSHWPDFQRANHAPMSRAPAEFECDWRPRALTVS